MISILNYEENVINRENTKELSVEFRKFSEKIYDYKNAALYIKN